MTKAKTWAGYIQEVVDMAGTDLSVGRYLGYGDGSRVGIWRKGQGRGDELACVKLARWTGDDPLVILRIAGYDELADLLDGHVAPPPVSIAAMRPALVALDQMIRTTLEMSKGTK